MINATSRRPGRVLDPAKGAAILDGARAVFMREGFAQGSMDAVAAEAGVGKQTIYRHFRSKEALVVALVEAMCAPEVREPPPSSLPARERLRELLLTFASGVAGPDSVRLYRAIVAEADRMPGLGRLFWEAGPRQVRAVIAQLWAEDHDPATAPIVAEQLVQLALGDAYQELVLGTGSPGPEIFERQIDAALALVELMPRGLRQRKRTARGPSASGPRSTIPV
jgi:TetR/AcrR family transcriptional regulator, mexJK operon transcriptional repressor